MENLGPVNEVNAEYSESLIIQLFTLTNKNGVKLVVSDFGATVISLCIHDRKGELKDIVLGYEDEKQYVDDEYYLGSLVGRYANRIAGDTIIIDGIAYKISVREGGYHLHGGFSGFNKKLFSAAKFVNNNDSGVVFRYLSPHLEEGFPGNLNLEVIYTLDDENKWTVEYRASTDRTTIVNFTQHSYFNLSGDPTTTVDNHEMRIDSRIYLPVNDLQMPTGVLEDVAGTPFDFTRFRKIGEHISENNEQLVISTGYDHSWVLKKQHSHDLKHAASVREASTGIHLDVFTTEPAIHFYSGNYLDDVKGKYGLVYSKRTGFCLETQHFPDSPNHAHFPSAILKANELFYSKTIFKLSVE